MLHVQVKVSRPTIMKIIKIDIFVYSISFNILIIAFENYKIEKLLQIMLLYNCCSILKNIYYT